MPLAKSSTRCCGPGRACGCWQPVASTSDWPARSSGSFLHSTTRWRSRCSRTAPGPHRRPSTRWRIAPLSPGFASGSTACPSRSSSPRRGSTSSRSTRSSPGSTTHCASWVTRAARHPPGNARSAQPSSGATTCCREPSRRCSPGSPCSPAVSRSKRSRRSSPAPRSPPKTPSATSCVSSTSRSCCARTTRQTSNRATGCSSRSGNSRSRAFRPTATSDRLVTCTSSTTPGSPRRSSPSCTRPDRRRWMGLISDETANFRAALAWAFDPDGGSPEAGARLIAALGWAWYATGRHAEGRSWADLALEATRDERSSLRGRVLGSASIFASGDSDIDAVGCARGSNSVTLGDELGSPYLQAYGRDMLGIARWVHRRLRRSSQAAPANPSTSTTSAATRSTGRSHARSSGATWPQPVARRKRGSCSRRASRAARDLNNETALGFALDASAVFALGLQGAGGGGGLHRRGHRALPGIGIPGRGRVGAQHPRPYWCCRRRFRRRGDRLRRGDRSVPPARSSRRRRDRARWPGARRRERARPRQRGRVLRSSLGPESPGRHRADAERTNGGRHARRPPTVDARPRRLRSRVGERPRAAHSTICTPSSRR